jgi:hypothetical protein
MFHKHGLTWVGALWVLGLGAIANDASGQALTYGLAGGNEGWSSSGRDCVTGAMEDAVAIYNRYGHFEKHITANFNPGVPTAEGNYDGWISFGGSCNTRVALHEIAHTLGVGTYWGFNGGAWDQTWAAGRLVKLFDGQGAVISTGGSHFWPYGLNYDNEDGAAARERHCKLVSALRFDLGIVVDSDGDGMRDDWETFHFEDLSEGADGDPDADGITNLDEQESDADPNEACPVRDGETYVVRSQRSDRAITLVDDNATDGTELAVHTVDRTPAQQWTAHYVGGGFFRFTVADSDLVMEVPGTDTGSGRTLRITAWTNALQQQWRVVDGPGAEPGYFQISNRETGRVADCLDGAEGAPVQQYPMLGNITQQFWRFEALNAEADAGVDAGVDAAVADAGTDAAAGDASTPDASADDASIDTSDAGTDAMTTAPTPSTSSGCACSITSGRSTSQRFSAAAWLSLAALIATRVRRRRDPR